MIKLILDGRKNIEVKEGTTIEDIVHLSENHRLVVGGLVNNVVESLNYEFKKDCNFEFVYINSSLGKKIYEKTLLFLLAVSSKQVFKDREISIGYSLGGGIFFEYTDESDLSEEDIKKLKAEMKKIIEENYDINKLKATREDMKASIDKNIFLTNKELVDCLRDGILTLYELGGAYGYFYGDLLPSTGYLKVFDIIKYNHGAILLGCDKTHPDKVHEFFDNPKLFEEYEEFDKWLKDVGVTNIASLNKKIENNEIEELILASEARHEYLIAKAADKIITSKDKKRIILIAGPSSSGKTTTSKRLQTHLMARGLSPVTIGLDDYFLNRDITPKDEDGKPMYECLEAIDVSLFNEHLLKLINGEEVEIPIFDFHTGTRKKFGRKIKVSENNPIIIEGIHGLNERLTVSVPDKDKFKIYICPFTVMGIDQYNRITTSKIRMLRRIVRDTHARSKKAIDTISMWEDVRSGEKVNIIPYREQADYIINSTLLYEIPILKKYAYPLLQEIGRDEKYYYEARHLLDFLSFFRTIEDEEYIPGVSILKEFIGGSFYE
ncbi:nucleoside kinase [Anaerofustis stercorihominis]|uniref:nucleoside kinase n=1 Tax=Anaerofustis stercorihominis TaxID=214853 RepID=UPI00214AD937|nr:nucleoside kinase [Anaerofustis stercorihominis]MCR2033742.1 nucleoside kinase [Anaerofustis stercorihominis]